MSRGVMDWAAFRRLVLAEPPAPRCKDCEVRLEETVAFNRVDYEYYDAYECPECGRTFIRDPAERRRPTER